MSEGTKRRQYRMSQTNRRRFIKGAGVSGVAALAGCASGGSDGTTNNQETGGTSLGSGSSDTYEIDAWIALVTEGAKKRQYIESLAKDFEEKTGHTVNIKGVPYEDMTRKAQAAASGGNLPNLSEISNNMSTLNFARDITDIFNSMAAGEKTAGGLVNTHKVLGKQMTGNDDTLLTWPLGARIHFSCWRRDWLEQAGVDPATVNHTADSAHLYNDLEPVYKKLKQADLAQQQGNYPSMTALVESDCEYHAMYLGAWGAGLTGVVNEAGTASTLDTKEGRKAVSQIKEFIDKGYYHPGALSQGDEQSTANHWAGKIAENQIQDVIDYWVNYRSEKPQAIKNGEYIWGLPAHGSTKATFAYLTSLAFMEDSFEDKGHLEATAQFANYWSIQRAVDNSKQLGITPVYPEVLEDSYFGQSELHKNFWRGSVQKTLNEFKIAALPAVSAASEINYAIPHQMWVRILQNDMPIDEATTRAAEKINELLQQ